MKIDSWIFEAHDDMKHGYKVKDILYHQQSKYQEVVVLETEGYGKALYLDGLLMLTEKHEFFYHDVIVHPAMFVHKNPEYVLIIGGGDGGSLREVLKHKEVKKVDMVEIDEKVVEASKKFFPTLNIGFDNPKANIMFDDGIKFVKETNNKYDIIIVDSSDPIGPAEGLFNEDFYRNAYKSLKEDGIIVSQVESPLFYEKFFKAHFEMNRKIFPIAMPMIGFEPDYPYGMWGYSFLSRKYHPLNDFNEDKVINSDIKTRYYNIEVHKALFAYPNFVRDLIGE